MKEGGYWIDGVDWMDEVINDVFMFFFKGFEYLVLDDENFVIVFVEVFWIGFMVDLVVGWCVQDCFDWLWQFMYGFCM